MAPDCTLELVKCCWIMLEILYWIHDRHQSWNCNQHWLRTWACNYITPYLPGYNILTKSGTTLPRSIIYSARQSEHVSYILLKSNRVEKFDLDLQGQSSWSLSAIKAVSFFCFEAKRSVWCVVSGACSLSAFALERQILTGRWYQ